MTTERVEAITEAVMALAQRLADCSSEEREAIGQRVYGNIRHDFAAYMQRPYNLPMPVDNGDAFQWLFVFTEAAAREARTGVPVGDKGDA